MTSSVFYWAQIAGGLALFLMGVKATSEGFRRCMGKDARHKMAEVTDRKPMAFGFGILLSAVTQSSAVATSFAVGLVDVGMLSLSGSLVVMIGASVGGTFVTLLLGLPIVQLAPGFLAIAYFASELSKGKLQNLAIVVRGVSLVLTGMFVIKVGVAPLMADPGFASILTSLSTRPWVMGIVATISAAVLQSSAAVMALAIALAGAGSLPLESIYPIVMGSHAGSSVIVFIASLSGRKNARLLGIGSALYKIIGVLFILPFSFLVPYVLDMISFLSIELRCVVLQFTVVWLNAFIVLPFTDVMAGGLRLLLSRDRESIGEPAYLNPKLVDFPGLALPLLDRELARLAGFLGRESELILSQIGDIETLKRLRDGTEELMEATSEYFDSIEVSGKESTKVSYGRVAYTLESLKSVKDAINKGLLPLHLDDNGDRRTCPLPDDVDAGGYRNIMIELVRSAMGALALGDLGMAYDVDRLYEKLKQLDENIRRDIFRRGNYGRGGGLEYLAAGNRLAKACTQLSKGEKMAFEMSSRESGSDEIVEMVCEHDE
nr:Na/Pi symporter [uncultured Dethiosulfovibrio sp.]